MAQSKSTQTILAGYETARKHVKASEVIPQKPKTTAKKSQKKKNKWLRWLKRLISIQPQTKEGLKKAGISPETFKKKEK